MSRVRAALASLTAGQRWTACLAVALGVAVLLFGTPEAAAPLTSPAVASAAASPIAGAEADATPAEPDAVQLPTLDLAAPTFGNPTATPERPPAPPPTTSAPKPADPDPEPAPEPSCVPPGPITLTGVAQVDAVLCVLFAPVPAP